MKKTNSRFAALRLAALPLLLAMASPLIAAPFATGDVFAAVSNGNVNHYSSTGLFKATYNIGAGGFTTGMAFDGGGNLYVTGFSVNTIAKFDTNGNLLDNNVVSAGLGTPESIVFDTTGNMYVGNISTGIQKYNSAGTYLGNVIGVRVDFFDLSADQSKFIYGQEGNDIKTVSNALPGVSGPNFGTGAGVAFSMRYLPDGGVLVAGGGTVVRYNAAGTIIQTYDPAADTLFALNLDPNGTSFWTSTIGGSVYKINIATGAIELNFSTGSSSTYGLAIFGEETAGGPPPPPPTSGVPDTGSSLSLLALALCAVAVARRKFGVV